MALAALAPDRAHPARRDHPRGRVRRRDDGGHRASTSTASSPGVFAGGAALAGLSGVIAGSIQSAYPADGREHPDPGPHRGRGGRPRQPQGLARVGSLIIGQAETFGKAWLPGASMLIIYVVMALVAAAPAPGALRPPAEHAIPRAASGAVSALAVAARRRLPGFARRRLPGEAPPGDPDLGHLRHEPRSADGLRGHGVLRPLRLLRRRRLRAPRSRSAASPALVSALVRARAGRRPLPRS